MLKLINLVAAVALCQSDNYTAKFCTGHIRTEFKRIRPLFFPGNQHLWGAESFDVNSLEVYYTGGIDGTIYAFREGELIEVIDDIGRPLGVEVVETRVIEPSKQIEDVLLVSSFVAGTFRVHVRWKVECNDRTGCKIKKLRDDFVSATKHEVIGGQRCNAMYPIFFPTDSERFGLLITHSSNTSADQSIEMDLVSHATGSLIYIKNFEEPESAQILLQDLAFANGVLCRKAGEWRVECWLAQTSILGRLTKLTLTFNEKRDIEDMQRKDIYLGPYFMDNLKWMNIADWPESSFDKKDAVVRKNDNERSHISIGISHQVAPNIAKMIMRYLPAPEWFSANILQTADQYLGLVSRLLKMVPRKGGLAVMNVEDECLEAEVQGTKDQKKMLSTVAEAFCIKSREVENANQFEFLIGSWGPVAASIGTIEVPDAEFEEENAFDTNEEL